tara:strand:- start:2956 stop:3198 length:243 start_codon:yes stop_codon:yes gene_type:complete
MMREFTRGFLIGLAAPILLIIFLGANNQDNTNELLTKIQHDISNIESDVYRMSEKGVSCIGAVRCGGGFVDSINSDVSCK